VRIPKLFRHGHDDDGRRDDTGEKLELALRAQREAERRLRLVELRVATIARRRR
jgi:hypothetical protein